MIDLIVILLYTMFNYLHILFCINIYYVGM